MNFIVTGKWLLIYDMLNEFYYKQIIIFNFITRYVQQFNTLIKFHIIRQRFVIFLAREDVLLIRLRLG